MSDGDAKALLDRDGCLRCVCVQFHSDDGYRALRRQWWAKGEHRCSGNARVERRGTWFLLRILVRVYGCADPCASGRLIRDRTGAELIAAAAFASNLSFFLITNFMVWASGNTYSHTIGGLWACFLAGVPFYRNQILGDAFYTAAIFGGYALIQRLSEPTGEPA